MTSWWLWCVMCLPSPWQLRSVPGPGSPSHVTWPSAGLSLVSVSWGQLLIGHCHHNKVGGSQRRGVRCEQFILAEDRNIFSAVCDALLHLISSPEEKIITCWRGKQPDPEEDQFQSQGWEKEKSNQMFPDFLSNFLSMKSILVKWKKVKIKTFTLDMSIYHPLFHKLWS